MFRRKPRITEPPDWLVVGLGNPGGEYDGTRHNVGFEVVRVLAERHKLKLTTRRFSAHFGFGRIGEATACLAKPMTYMNLSGHAASTLLRHFNLPVGRMIVVYDDMDLELGRVRIQPQGGAGSHNGMKSVIQSIGSKEFPRVRIGIGSPTVTGVDHVLSRFGREEIDDALAAIQTAARGCELILGEGIDIAMNRINKPAEEKT